MMAACATGPALKEQSPALPALETGQARVYFYRTSVVGGASELAVLLNGQQVGNAIPRSVFFRDVAPGKYSVTTAMSSQVVKFELAAGDTKIACLVDPAEVPGHEPALRVKRLFGRLLVVEIAEH